MGEVLQNISDFCTSCFLSDFYYIFYSHSVVFWEFWLCNFAQHEDFGLQWSWNDMMPASLRHFCRGYDEVLAPHFKASVYDAGCCHGLEGWQGGRVEGWRRSFRILAVFPIDLIGYWGYLPPITYISIDFWLVVSNNLLCSISAMFFLSQLLCHEAFHAEVYLEHSRTS